MHCSIRTAMTAALTAAAAAACVAAAQPASAAPVDNRTVFATTYQNGVPAQLYRHSLSSTGAVVARTAVQHGAGGVATDMAAGRVLFTRPGVETTSRDDEIWIREPSGASRKLTTGTDAVFTPGRTAVLFSRLVQDADPQVAFDVHHEFWLKYLSDGRERLLFRLPDGNVSWDFRYTHDGSNLWMTTYQAGVDDRALRVYRFSERRFVKAYPPGCTGIEMLPSGQRVLLECLTADGKATELRTVSASTGQVLSRKQPGHEPRGRLSASVLLVSDWATNRFGALDLSTFTVRWLAGGTGRHAVTEYDVD